MNKQQQKLKETLNQHIFKPIIFDGNKYNNHIEAFINSDFKVLIKEEYDDKYQSILDQYYIMSDTIEKSNQLLNNNVKFIVPLYHLNIFHYKFHEFYNDRYNNEGEVIKNFFIFLFENFGDELILTTNNNSELLSNQIQFIKENTFEFFEDILFQDYLGNISLKGKSLYYYFNLLIEKNIDFNKVKEIIKYNNF